MNPECNDLEPTAPRNHHRDNVRDAVENCLWWRMQSRIAMNAGLDGASAEYLRNSKCWDNATLYHRKYNNLATSSGLELNS